MTVSLPTPRGDAEEGVCPLSNRELIDKILIFIQFLNDCELYRYQQVFARRIVDSLLRSDAATITALLARQCLDGDSIVLRRDGSAVRIKDHEDAWSTGVKPTKRYDFRGGSSIVMTDNHPVMTESGWLPAGMLKVGDKVADLCEWDCWGSTTVSEDEAAFLGYMVTGGSFDQRKPPGTQSQSPKFTNINMKYLDEVDDLYRKIFGLNAKWYPKGKGFDLLLVGATRRTPNVVGAYLADMSWDEGFPTDVFTWDKERVCTFVNRAWSGDGCVHIKKRGQDVFLACGNSRVFASYWQSLLLKLGVSSCVKEEWMQKPTKPFFRLVLGSGAVNLRKFFSLVGPIFGKEKKSTELIARLDEQAKQVGKGKSERLMRKVESVGEDGEKLTFSMLHKITDSGDREVFDVTYPGKGWFIGQGIKVHNSGKTETVATVGLGLTVIFPALAKAFPNDKRLRRFTKGFWVGIFAPTQKHSGLIYVRMRDRAQTDRFARILQDPELSLAFLHARGDSFAFDNGSKVEAHTASENTLSEGYTYHLILIDEAQKVSAAKISKELAPMLSSTMGTMVQIGTAHVESPGFFRTIRKNLEDMRAKIANNHYEFDYKVIIKDRRAKYNDDGKEEHLFYERWLEKEIHKIGGNLNDDSFKKNFRLIWSRFTSIAIDIEGFKKLARPDLELNKPFHRPGRIVAGLDVAKSKDSTWLVIGHVDTANPLIDDARERSAPLNHHAVYYHVMVVAMHRMQGNFEGNYGQYADIVRILNQYRTLDTMHVDATGMGDPVYERMKVLLPQVRVEPVKYTLQSKHALYKHYLQEIGAKRFSYASGGDSEAKILVEEFERQHENLVKEYSGQFMRVQAEDTNDQDDAPDATSLMLDAVATEGVPEVDVSGDDACYGVPDMDAGGIEGVVVTGAPKRYNYG